jgi:hypothetical protein
MDENAEIYLVTHAHGRGAEVTECGMRLEGPGPDHTSDDSAKVTCPTASLLRSRTALCTRRAALTPGWPPTPSTRWGPKPHQASVPLSAAVD